MHHVRGPEAVAVWAVRQVLHHQAQPGDAHAGPQRHQAPPLSGLRQVLQAAQPPQHPHADPRQSAPSCLLCKEMFCFVLFCCLCGEHSDMWLCYDLSLPLARPKFWCLDIVYSVLFQAVSIYCSKYTLRQNPPTSDMGFFRRSADFRRLRGPTGHFWDQFKSVEKIIGYI